LHPAVRLQSDDYLSHTMFSNLFKLRGTLEPNQKLVFGILGVIVLLGIWTVLANQKSRLNPVYERVNVNPLPSNLPQHEYDSLTLVRDRADSMAMANATQFERIYPVISPPQNVIASFPELIKKNGLIVQTSKSLWLNFKGYFWAIILAIPLGFIVGLLPIFNGMFNKPVDALRYLPLTALTGLFMAWFGTDDKMKVAFLAFGIIVYLLPIVAQRITEVKEVYLKTVFTLGANSWQTIKTVYIPSVLSKISDDIRVLTAISWTYIIVAELVNSTNGGIGAMIYKNSRFANKDKVFAILLVIILIGLFQDRYFKYLDRQLFPFKYQQKEEISVWRNTMNYIVTVFSLLFVAIAVASLFVPQVKFAMDKLIGDGFYVLLSLAVIELLLKVKKLWPSLSDRLFSKPAPKPA